MNASGATPPTGTVFTVFDALLSTGLSAADVDSELRSGSVTISGRVVTDPYTPVARSYRVWLGNTLVTSPAVIPTGGALRLAGHQRAALLVYATPVTGPAVHHSAGLHLPVLRQSRRRQYRC